MFYLLSIVEFLEFHRPTCLQLQVCLVNHHLRFINGLLHVWFLWLMLLWQKTNCAWDTAIVKKQSLSYFYWEGISLSLLIVSVGDTGWLRSTLVFRYVCVFHNTFTQRQTTFIISINQEWTNVILVFSWNLVL